MQVFNIILLIIIESSEGVKMNEFQERLQELLVDNNLSRLQLAKALNISSTTINGYFNNDYYPEISIAVKIANHFNCSLDFLFGLSDISDFSNRNNNSFFENFNNLIKESGISISKTMKNLKMSEFNYYRWRDGLLPKTVNLIDLAKYFDVSIEFLLGNNL